MGYQHVARYMADIVHADRICDRCDGRAKAVVLEFYFNFVNQSRLGIKEWHAKVI